MPSSSRPIDVATVNVNGIRAAARRGLYPWLATAAPDVLCTQEVRAPAGEVDRVLGAGWHGVQAEAATRGHAGVAVHCRTPPLSARIGLGSVEFDPQGRWAEVDLDVSPGLLTVVTTYVHTGGAGTPRQAEKYRFLDAVGERLRTLAADGRHVLACGDLNICHHDVDLKNWRGNRGKAGFLPAEREWLSGLLADGFVDVGRRLGGDGPGPYTWWSWRGSAFDNDAGWRIDYQLASPDLASRAVTADVHRASSYAQRWSDHAPLVVRYQI